MKIKNTHLARLAKKSEFKIIEHDDDLENITVENLITNEVTTSNFNTVISMLKASVGVIEEKRTNKKLKERSKAMNKVHGTLNNVKNDLVEFFKSNGVNLKVDGSFIKKDKHQIDDILKNNGDSNFHRLMVNISDYIVRVNCAIWVQPIDENDHGYYYDQIIYVWDRNHESAFENSDLEMVTLAQLKKANKELPKLRQKVADLKSTILKYENLLGEV